MVQQRIRNLTLDGGNGSGSDQMPGSATSCSVLIESFAFSCVTTDPDPTLRDWRKWIRLKLFREKWIRIQLWIEGNGYGSNSFGRKDPDPTLLGVLDPDPTKCPDPLLLAWADVRFVLITSFTTTDPDPTLDWEKWIRIQLFRGKWIRIRPNARIHYFLPELMFGLYESHPLHSHVQQCRSNQNFPSFKNQIRERYK